jgi:hypothetical protein
MSTHLALQHDEWHRIHGKYQSCPLDCSDGEVAWQRFEEDAEALVESGARGISCGACKNRHAFVATVKFCYEVKYDSETFARNEAAMTKAIEEGGECEHGLSAALCSGPGHYPMDRYDD